MCDLLHITSTVKLLFGILSVGEFYIKNILKERGTGDEKFEERTHTL